MRISDWSSDVCSSDLLAEVHGDADAAVAGGLDRFHAAHAHADVEAALFRARHLGLGRAAGATALEQARGDGFAVVQARLAVIRSGGVGGEGCVQWTNRKSVV